MTVFTDGVGQPQVEYAKFSPNGTLVADAAAITDLDGTRMGPLGTSWEELVPHLSTNEDEYRRVTLVNPRVGGMTARGPVTFIVKMSEFSIAARWKVHSERVDLKEVEVGESPSEE